MDREFKTCRLCGKKRLIQDFYKITGKERRMARCKTCIMLKQQHHRESQGKGVYFKIAYLVNFFKKTSFVEQHYSKDFFSAIENKRIEEIKMRKAKTIKRIDK